MGQDRRGINLLSNYKPKSKLKTAAKFLLSGCVYAFAMAGFLFIGTYYANRLHLTDVTGAVDAHNGLFMEPRVAGDSVTNANGNSPKLLADMQQSIDRLNDDKLARMKLYCKITAINSVAGSNARTILDAYKNGSPEALTGAMAEAVSLRLSDAASVQFSIGQCSALTVRDSVADLLATGLPGDNTFNVFSWTEDDTWPVLRSGIMKDKDAILQASQAAGVEPRLVVAAMFAEQTRMFRTQRGLFKKYLAPLDILASANQFSLGVMGIKQATRQRGGRQPS